MAFSTIIDITNKINENPSNVHILDTGAYSQITVQLVGGNNVDIQTSNDGGAVEGILLPSAISADNFVDCFGTKSDEKAPNENMTNTVTNTYLLTLKNFGKYIKFTGQGNVDKCILFCYQVY
jgi:hypothetical protein